MIVRTYGFSGGLTRPTGNLGSHAGTLSCLAHHGTPLSKRCPTTTALERTACSPTGMHGQNVASGIGET